MAQKAKKMPTKRGGRRADGKFAEGNPHRFNGKPGPGRPKSGRGFLEQLRDHFATVPKDPKTGKPMDKTYLHLMFNEAFRLVLTRLRKGDATALRTMQDLFDRAYGRAPEKHEVTGVDGGPIQQAVEQTIPNIPPDVLKKAGKELAQVLADSQEDDDDDDGG
jgi:hypothetical protein